MEKTFKIFKGFIMSLAIFLISTVFFACLLKFTAVPEKWGMIYLMVCLSLSTLFFGLFIGNLTRRRGLIYGGLGGVLFVILLWYSITTLLGLPFNLGADDLRYLVPVIFGCVGGPIGVNLKK